jgi:hypothetical protein
VVHTSHMDHLLPLFLFLFLHHYITNLPYFFRFTYVSPPIYVSTTPTLHSLSPFIPISLSLPSSLSLSLFLHPYLSLSPFIPISLSLSIFVPISLSLLSSLSLSHYLHPCLSISQSVSLSLSPVHGPRASVVEGCTLVLTGGLLR